MAYDLALAERIRNLLADRTDVVERRMFGGLTFMVGGHMCCGVNGDELIVRVRPAREEHALTRPHPRPMDFTGRRMRGFVTVEARKIERAELEAWVHDALANALSLAPRPPR